MRNAGIPSCIPANPAMRVDEFIYRDIPDYWKGTKRIIKNLIGRK
jgi:hypothetical protein